MLSKGLVFVALALLAGCAPSHSAWVSSRDGSNGTPMDSHIRTICSQSPGKCSDSFWSPVNQNRVFDRVVEEGQGKRYYITWIRDCRYSVWVDENRVVKSWRYETENTGSCYIF
ncbi:hypothetical protein [Pseudomonas sp. 52 E 6]|nr:hypothetical protein [Pseudomonas sp. 24 R 17]CRM18601.1 hypothetical protein [Pseudomonas sp. 58 R 12]CRM47390.1 hypothetical protein [Pseudomonas sp. 52 E 6]